MAELAESISDNWPVDRIELRCDKCDAVINSIDGDNLTIETASYAEKLIRHIIDRHIRKRSHISYTVTVMEHQVLEDINCEITVNEN